ncbi:tetratricopeptide repeat protein [Prosthecobacter sp.]|uniref:tetratricopeptide repeat protein n=1 Tax=Prosthecobacter sp. TaxID=1965333 RepID=UPI00378397CE
MLAAVSLALLLGRAEGAESDLEARLTTLPGLSQEEKPPKATAFSLGLRALEAKDYAGALAQFENAVSEARIDATPICWLTAQYQVCHTLNLLGKSAEAVVRAREMVTECEVSLGEEDPITSEALSHLAFLLKNNGRLTEAEPVYARNLASLVEKHGDDSFFSAGARTRLADLLMLLGRMEEAESHHRQALAAAQTCLGQEHTDVCFFMTHLAYCLHVVRKKTEAAELMDKAFAIVRNSDALKLSNATSLLRRQAEFFRDSKQMDKARLTGRLCLTRLAAGGESNRIRFFYYDRVKELYHSILAADGLKPQEIQNHLTEVETQARGDR